MRWPEEQAEGEQGHAEAAVVCALHGVGRWWRGLTRVNDVSDVSDDLHGHDLRKEEEGAKAALRCHIRTLARGELAERHKHTRGGAHDPRDQPPPCHAAALAVQALARNLPCFHAFIVNVVFFTRS